MKTQHTEGPWKLEPLANVVIDSGRILVATPYHRGGNKEEQQANAQLISAAPEMLQELHKIYFTIPRDNSLWEDSSQARQMEDLLQGIKQVYQKATGIELPDLSEHQPD